MITVTRHAEHHYDVACTGADGCGQAWPGLYSALTAGDVARTHHHGPRADADQLASGRAWGFDREVARLVALGRARREARQAA